MTYWETKMARETKTTIELTEAELIDLSIILKTCQREGWCYGRRDYWAKHLKKIYAEVELALNYLENQR